MLMALKNLQQFNSVQLFLVSKVSDCCRRGACSNNVIYRISEAEL